MEQVLDEVAVLEVQLGFLVLRGHDNSDEVLNIISQNLGPGSLGLRQENL